MPLTRATTRAATATLLIAIAITTCHSPLLSPPLHLPFTLLCHHHVLLHHYQCHLNNLDTQGLKMFALRHLTKDGQFQPPGRCAHLTPLWYWLST
ncbi:hypothetical protein F5148DRAFT_1203137 [Russula earlei]|uniref:Uncharacterized protein n=1 Tax=Russula earlei TaxID=71964 RepID=A0ACC0U7R0_9AGAM|nr:hypothetical protein F5148DRAFT_1203137 [Russula earlei]